ncbi:IclR family transcriptional regulator domain-containing protein [Corynebacterium tapiri]|uniref:Helix-turn-helix domain-containing protein n=1 Tax=Corynebacterium tapiri TaxID=1448266 RepID=A0A5C4U4E8_9CORY|nr:IclR family transcriptional regulator C-terminal domain-containing protein [Corynebacterium tapiri]TNL96659.1 helix-turn-helix domain-containing protein [Corynebacterium tapiri]
MQSLVRGLNVIRSFNARHPRQSLAQVADRTDLARATARRFLLTLVNEGYADTDGSEFWLTPRVLELGYSYMSGLGLPSIAQPRLEQLSRQVGESASMSVLDEDEIVYVNRVPVRRIMTVSITIGTRFPALTTSMGRVLLAFHDAARISQLLKDAELTPLTPHTKTTPQALRAELEQVRSQGFSIVDQELEAGLRSVAAPVYSPTGEVIAAINVSTQSSQYDLTELHDRILTPLLQTARDISADLSAAQLH